MIELELKLRITPEDASKLWRRKAFRSRVAKGPRRKLVYNTYFDTPDRLLQRHQMGLRIRRVAGRWLQTLKRGAASADGLARRHEWETPIAGPQLELEKLGDDAAREVLRRVTGLQPLFTTDFWRTTWELRGARRTRIELAHDRGEIRAGRRREAIDEIELELLAGDEQVLREIAREFGQAVTLLPEDRSKAHRGYALLG